MNLRSQISKPAESLGLSPLDKAGALDRTVFWIAGSSGSGKSTLGLELEARGFEVFRTDQFILSLPTWCSDRFLTATIRTLGYSRIGEYLEEVEKAGKGAQLAQLMRDPIHGFAPKDSLSAIEGFLPAAIQKRFIEDLETDGFRVWLAARQSSVSLGGHARGLGRKLKRAWGVLSR